MTIGQSLAAARARSGLSIAALEERTRIRGQVISAIERDEFGPCGGDFYARGHVRQLARTLGLDPKTLLARFPEQRETEPEVPDPTSGYGAEAPPRRPSVPEVFAAQRIAAGTEPPRVNWTLLMAIASVVVLLLGVTQAFLGSGGVH